MYILLRELKLISSIRSLVGEFPEALEKAVELLFAIAVRV